MIQDTGPIPDESGVPPSQGEFAGAAEQAPKSGQPRKAWRPTGRRFLISGLTIAAIAAALALWLVSEHREAEEDIASAAGGSATMAGDDMGGMSMSGGAVQLTGDELRQFGVTFGTVQERTLDNSVRTVGMVTVDETKLSEVTARFGGYVERLYADETGRQVHKGQPLMDVYSPELLAAEQELLIAAKLQQSMGQSGIPGMPNDSTDLVSAARRRLALWGISVAQIDEILRTGAVRRTLTLYAPESGVVLEKGVVQGQAIQPGEMLYRIANLSEVWIEVAIREQDAAAVRAGSRAIVELASYPGRPLTGRVAYVYPTVDEAARTVRARVEVANPAGLLKPGMYATVRLTTPSRRTLTVPSLAVLNTGERTLVFMDMGGGRLMPMDIVTGRIAGSYTEVLSGLEPGQRVVTSAQYLLDSESNLAEVMKSMIGQMGTSDMGNMRDAPGMDMSGRRGGVSMPRENSEEINDKGAEMKGMKMPPSPDTTRR